MEPEVSCLRENERWILRGIKGGEWGVMLERE